MAKGEKESLQVLGAVLGFLQKETCPADNDFAAVFDEAIQRIHDGELLRTTLMNGEHVNTKRCFHRSEFEDLVNNNLWTSITLEGDFNASLVIGEVTHSRDIEKDFLTHQFGNTLLKHRTVYPVWNIGDGDDGSTRGLLLDFHGSAHLNTTATGVEIAVDSFESADFAFTGEIGAFDILLEFINGKLWIIDSSANTIDHLPHIVGWDVGGHTHGDTCAAVD